MPAPPPQPAPTAADPRAEIIARLHDGRRSEAEHLARRLLQSSPQDAITNHLLAVILSEGKRRDEVTRLLAASDAAGGVVSTRPVRESLALRAAGKTAEAETLTRCATELLTWNLNVERLHAGGRAHEAESECVKSLAESDPELVRAAGLFLTGNSYYAAFEKARAALQNCAGAFERDVPLLTGLAYACWFAGRAEEAITHAREAIRWGPETANVYRALGMYELTAGRHLDAYVTLRAGAAGFAPGADPFSAFREVARRLMTGDATARFTFDGVPMAFRLTAMNGMALESDAHHVMGVPTEQEELKYCRRFVPQGATIVEVGTLIGNHTVYFQQALRPRKIIGFDANPRCLAEVRHNIELNRADGPGASPVEIDLRHAAVGDGAGEIDFPTVGRAPLVRLDDAIREKAQFYKIDVDGAEIDVLRGMKRILREDAPRLMIEVDQVNESAFAPALQDANYRILHHISHGSYTNYFVEPTSGPPPGGRG